MEQLKDCIEMAIGERIKMILFKKASKEEEQVLNKGDQIIENLDEEKKAAMMAYLDIRVDREAENEMKAYIGGVKDGICLITWINRMCDECRI